MGTIVLYALIAIIVAAAIVALLVLVLPEERLSRPIPDVVPMGLPFDREVGADDLNRMRLPVSVRGYRMVDADAVFDRLSAEIERRDQEIAQLRAAVADSVPDPAVATHGSDEPPAEPSEPPPTSPSGPTPAESADRLV
ncbi:MAG: hypothetical protein JWM76_3680 [Pseudonocardiales bacterium]|nr:hypothetical protein [Pseudonocardiales bacterium]